MKNYIILISVICYFLFNGRFSLAQTWKAQSCTTCCWAAATENVLKSTTECTLLKQTRSVGYISNCSVLPDEDFSQSKFNYINQIKKNASFSHLDTTFTTLTWNSIKNIIKPTSPKPMIASFDNNDAGNHFVNIYGTLSSANKQWLYTFDPYLLKKGVHYLKNYQTYQLPGKNGSIQCTYWGFGRQISGTNFKVTKIIGTNSIVNVYSDAIKIKNTINNILNYSRNLFPENITGLKARDSLIPVDMSSMILLSNVITSFPSLPRSDTVTMLSSTTIVQRATDTFIIPIFKDSSTFLVFKSMIFLLRDLNNNNNYVIDRIQKLNVPIKLNKDDVFIYTRERSRSIHLPIELPIDFILQQDGVLNIKIKDKIFDVSYNNPTSFNESQFYEKLLKLDRRNTYINREIKANSLNLNTSSFKQVLIDKGFEIQGDLIKLDGRNEKIIDFQQRLKNIPDYQKIIILDKN